MKKIFSVLTAVFIITAFLLPKSTRAEEVNTSCDPVDLESVLTKAIAEKPELLVDILDQDKLQKFFLHLRDKGWMVGIVNIDKIYVFRSENHPSSVYLFYIRNGCIHAPVILTSKTVIEGIE